MGIVEIIFIAIGLAMDAFAVAISKGLSMKKSYKNAVIIGFYFGIFQALMPTIGYFLGFSFENIVTKIDHFIAFTLLTIIGLSMIIENNNEQMDDKINFKDIFVKND